MCLQDVRIARVADTQIPIEVAASTTATRALRANPRRYSLTVACSMLDPSVGTFYYLVWTPMGEQIFPLMVLNPDHPSQTINLLDIGQPIVGEIWVRSTTGVTPDLVYIGEAAFDRDLEGI